MRNSRDSLDELQHLLRASPEDYDQDHSHSNAPLTQSPQRWCAVVGYFLTASTVSVMMSSSWLIGGALQKLYGMNEFVVQLFSYFFFLAPLLRTIPASYVIELHSLTTSLTIGVVCTSVGAWLRSFINATVVLAFMGQCLGALGLSFFFNAPSQIAAKWYFPHNRASATLILSLCPFLFAFISPVLSSLAVDRPPSQISTDLVAFYKDRISLYFRLEAVYVTLAGLAGLLIFKEGPRSPPSLSQFVKRQTFSQSFRIFRNWSYLLCLCSCGISVGIFNALTLFVQDLLMRRGLKTNQVGLTYLIYIPVALGFTLFCGFISRLTERIKFLLLLTQAGLLLVLVLFLAFYDSHNSTRFVILLVIQAALVAPVLGLNFEAVADLAFPVGEAFSAGFVVGAVSLFSFFFSVLLRPLLSTNKEQIIFVVFVLFQALALLCSLLVKDYDCPRRLADNDLLLTQNEKDNFIEVEKSRPSKEQQMPF